ncbi:MAG: TatD family hydrolase [Candidatus Thorarchaeota archaeon]|jgi:TatD DNase family protein
MLVDMHFHIDSRWHKPELVDRTIADIEKNRILVAAQGTDIPQSEEAVEISKRSDLVFPAFGVLPWYAHEHIERLDEIESYLGSFGMLGEIGLDYLYSPPEATPELQKKLLAVFVKDAEKHDKILNLHIRGASDDTFEFLSSYDVKRVILHAHTDSLESIKTGGDRGYYFTVNPHIVYNRDRERRKFIAEIVKNIPTDYILSEVDTVSSEMYEPPSVRLIASLDQIAKIRQTSYEDLIELIQKNAYKLLHGVKCLGSYAKLLE